jgi:hypothetical protein
MLKKAPVEGRPPDADPSIGDWKVMRISDQDYVMAKEEEN